MVVLDTNIIIDHLRQPKNKETCLRRIVRAIAQEDLAISIVSIQELYEGRSTKNRDKKDNLIATIASVRILPYTYEIAEIAGEIARDLDQDIEFADAAIAASAIANGARLATLNSRDFAGINGLDLIDIRSL